MQSADFWDELEELYGEPVDDLTITPRACIRCNVGRAQTPYPWPLIVVNEWISENHLLWSLSASLAETGLDEQWTQTFNASFSEYWTQIQDVINRTEPGAARSLLSIPKPPIEVAFFTHTVGRVNNNFAIVSTPPDTRAGAGLLNLLGYVYHEGIPLDDHFHVALCNGRVAARMFDLLMPSPQDLGWLPGSSGYTELETVPPPPYSEDSPLPPDYSP
ncbi:hypothetical protein N7457_004365 [Penicillium paradoxum]|uniref:uncharacterized protein n=1 Tax=Penicillium paradoxum TaxID=176176 RepID=UPI0025474D38|nr:uncharacterized protein N7457_004365 [Penicillium paradoxum]KAJ5782591.1 hypothetical protein N7457_004365 [Penicillium paradoxum]